MTLAPRTNGAGHPIPGPYDPPRPRRPPAPTSTHGLAPAGHGLDLARVGEHVSADGTRMVGLDPHVGCCGCGLKISSSTRLVHDRPPPASYVVAEWLDHLRRQEILDRDDLAVLRRHLVDAEHTARYGRPYHDRSPA